ncbi:MAG: hypothetical protein CMJ23_11675 [Phycisphaerae bacterium]|nr:hypothetical protein [Phycisphaerae bacterium]
MITVAEAASTISSAATSIAESIAAFRPATRHPIQRSIAASWVGARVRMASRSRRSPASSNTTAS